MDNETIVLNRKTIQNLCDDRESKLKLEKEKADKFWDRMVLSEQAEYYHESGRLHGMIVVLKGILKKEDKEEEIK